MRSELDIEIPLGKRTPLYRFFEMLPALLSYGSIVLLIVLSLLNPLLAAIYLLLVIITLFVKTMAITLRVIEGHNVLNRAQKVQWQHRLNDLQNPQQSLKALGKKSDGSWRSTLHLQNLENLAKSPSDFPKPSQLYNAVIIATYNESMEVLEPTVQSIIRSHYDTASQLILVIAYEERGGAAIEATVQALQKRYNHSFHSFLLVKHPKDLPRELAGKGSNITYAGKFLAGWLKTKKIAYENVIVTTLDSDNRPHPTYFAYVTYEYIVNPMRLQLAYQPVALFLGNIWDVPAPMRVLATGNTFWNIISSLRPYSLRNFAAHSQGMKPLVDMNFWSVRTIVEDGHQYWRSYVHFRGSYSVVPIHVPIYQDAVLSDTYRKTLKAQFVQLQRWAYGASDIAYVATHIFTRHRHVPLFPSLARLVRLIDSHVSWAASSIIIAFGAWVPLFLNQQATRSIIAQELPGTVSTIQTIALLGLLVSVYLSFKMLPPRPARYKRSRTIWMLAQWLLMPVTALIYTTGSAFDAQTRLLLGKYLDKFNVTDKAVKNDAQASSKKAERAR